MLTKLEINACNCMVILNFFYSIHGISLNCIFIHELDLAILRLSTTPKIHPLFLIIFQFFLLVVCFIISNPPDALL